MPPRTQFDYIVVGSGAGGGPVAANLAAAGFQVLLIEAGSEYKDLNYAVPAFHGQASEDPQMRWDFFVRHYTDQAQQEKDSKYVKDADGQRVDGILYPRCGTLGGCTAHHAMITIYPHQSDWEGLDRIARTFDPADDSWNPDRMRRIFERIERCGYIARNDNENRSRHGFDGWLGTSVADITLLFDDPALLKLILAAAEETYRELYTGSIDRFLDKLERLLEDGPELKAILTGGSLKAKREALQALFDPNQYDVALGHREGVFLVPISVGDGLRDGSRQRIQQAARDHAANLTIWTETFATKILFDGRRAVGVECASGQRLYQAAPAPEGGRASPSERRQALAGREVILSGGTYNTPQLLMLSGIGPADWLKDLGVPIIAELPAVGHYLQDRYEVAVISDSPRDFPILKNARFRKPQGNEQPDPPLKEWLEHRDGLYATNGAVVSIIRRSSPDKPDPDLYIFGLPARFKGYYPGYADALETAKNEFTWAILKAHTINKAGYVRPRSTNPFERPEINFRYFEEGSDTGGDDLNAVVEGVKFVRAFTRNLGLSARLLVSQEQQPGPSIQSDRDIAEWVKNEAWGHHACGTCRIGPKDDLEESCLDSNFRVKGVQGLRVVDASVFPSIPGFFIVTPIYMIAEKASESILRDAGWKPEAPPADGLNLPPVNWRDLPESSWNPSA